MRHWRHNLHSLSIAFFFFNITASIYTERFMGLPVESDNLEHYKVRILSFSFALNLNRISIDKQNSENIMKRRTCQLAKWHSCKKAAALKFITL